MENSNAYIESGVLEQYVLGELLPADRIAVEEAARQQPAIGQELAELGAGLEIYAQAHAQTPPAGLRERVLAGALAQIRSQSQSPGQVQNLSQDQTPAPPLAVAPSAPVAAVPTDSPLRINRATPPAGAADPAPASMRALYPDAAPARVPAWALAASVALLLSLAGNVALYSRWQRSDADLLAMQSQQTDFAATSQVVNRQLSQTQQQVAVLRDEQFRAVALAGTPAAPMARARVLYNPATRAVYLDVRRLPALPAGKQYQLWALDNGKPVDAGTLAAATATGQDLQQMKDIARAQAFAMTVEPTGGSVSPTLSTMTVMGAVTGS